MEGTRGEGERESDRDRHPVNKKRHSVMKKGCAGQTVMNEEDLDR